jgi:UDP-N-acetylmuramyl pentapeptide phosphotransferase/UDP-N-acetylglucosamine-1-phosphate transferase
MEKELFFLQNQQVGETVRELGLAQNEKAGTPTMGGLIIYSLLWCLLCCLQSCKIFT